MNVDIATKFSFSLGYSALQSRILTDTSKSSSSSEQTSPTRKRYIVTSMRIERYYESVKEDYSTLDPSALQLLNDLDYSGFFMACGANYVRSIRRAQELVAILTFESSSSENSADFANEIKVSNWNTEGSGGSSNVESNPTYNAETGSLDIEIKGFGLGINSDGSEGLVARTLEEYFKAIDFAFLAMTQQKSQHVGVVYGIEVTPWVENSSFMVQSQILDDVVEVPLPVSMIPKAYNPSDDTALFTNSVEDRQNFRCRVPTLEIDKYGLCCVRADLYDITTEVYDINNPESKVCRPVRNLDHNTIRDNLVANGEFLARVNAAYTTKMSIMNRMGSCISSIREIPDRYDYNLLTPKNGASNGAPEVRISLLELKMALDPFQDWAMFVQVSKELEEFLDMYVVPCYSSLLGVVDNFGLGPNNKGSDVTKAYPWYVHTACSKLSCLGKNMRWDRSNPDGGCVASILNGPSSNRYEMGTDDNCQVKVTTSNGVECKYPTSELATLHHKTLSCWNATIPSGSTNYYLDYFCEPEVSSEIMDADAKDILRKSITDRCGATQSQTFFQGKLYPNDYLYSSNYAYYLTYQNDGNLGLYKVSTGSKLWSSETSGQSAGYAEMDEHLKVFDKGLVQVYISDAGYAGGYLHVADDGNLVIYESNDESSNLVWETDTAQ